MKKCSKCGSLLGDNMRYCAYCGEPVMDRNRSNNTIKNKSGPKKKDISVKNVVRPINKPLRILISIIIGTAVLAGLAFFIEFTPGDTAHYAAQVSDVFKKYLGISSDSARRLGIITIHTAVGMTIFTIYMISLRTSKVIRKAVDNIDRLFVAIAECVIVYVPLYIYYNFKEESEGDFLENLSAFIRALVETHGVERLLVLLLLLLLIIVLLFFLAVVGMILSFAGSIIIELFKANIEINGVFFGILSSVYDMMSSIFVGIAAICMISFGVALILVPIFVCAAACSDGRRIVEIDGEYYYVD